MSAETLRRAVDAIRTDIVSGEWHDREDFVGAVADWLDQTHSTLSTYNATTPRSRCAFAVARAYLGELS